MSNPPTREQLKQSADEYVEELHSNAEDVTELKSEHKEHNWVDRGAKWSCETQTHECHAVWKRR